MEKDNIIAQRYWGTANRRAVIDDCNNKISVRGYELGYRNRNVIGPQLENIAEVPKKLRKEITALKLHRCPELSKAFSNFINEIWNKAKELDPWFNY